MDLKPIEIITIIIALIFTVIIRKERKSLKINIFIKKKFTFKLTHQYIIDSIKASSTTRIPTRRAIMGKKKKTRAIMGKKNNAEKHKATRIFALPFLLRLAVLFQERRQTPGKGEK